MGSNNSIFNKKLLVIAVGTVALGAAGFASAEVNQCQSGLNCGAGGPGSTFGPGLTDVDNFGPQDLFIVGVNDGEASVSSVTSTLGLEQAWFGATPGDLTGDVIDPLASTTNVTRQVETTYTSEYITTETSVVEFNETSTNWDYGSGFSDTFLTETSTIFRSYTPQIPGGSVADDAFTTGSDFEVSEWADEATSATMDEDGFRIISRDEYVSDGVTQQDDLAYFAFDASFLTASVRDELSDTSSRLSLFDDEASLTVTNDQGNEHGLWVGVSDTLLTGGINSSQVHLTDSDVTVGIDGDNELVVSDDLVTVNGNLTVTSTITAATGNISTVNSVTTNSSTVNASTTNSSTVNASTVNAATGNISTVNSVTTNSSTVNASTVNAATGNISTINNTTFNGVNGTFTNSLKVDTSNADTTIDGNGVLIDDGDLTVDNKVTTVLGSSSTVTGLAQSTVLAKSPADTSGTYSGVTNSTTSSTTTKGNYFDVDEATNSMTYQSLNSEVSDKTTQNYKNVVVNSSTATYTETKVRTQANTSVGVTETTGPSAYSLNVYSNNSTTVTTTNITGATSTVTTSTTNANTAGAIGVTATSASVTVKNAQGNTHGLTVGTTSTTLSGGTASTTLTLVDQTSGTAGATLNSRLSIQDGVNAQDAVTMNQFTSFQGTVNGQLAVLGGQIADSEEKLSKGIAVANSLEVFMPDAGKKFRVNVGAGHYNGESGLGVTGAGNVNEKVSVYFGVGTDFEGDETGGKVGVSYQW